MNIINLDEKWGIGSFAVIDFPVKGFGEGFLRNNHVIVHLTCNTSLSDTVRPYSNWLYGALEPLVCGTCGEEVPDEVLGYLKLCKSAEEDRCNAN